MRIPGIAILVFIILLAYSCNKSTPDNPVQDKLVGNWKNTMNVSDSNGNHILDIHDARDTINNPYIIQYNTNGTGAYLLNGTSAGTFTWQLLNNNTYLKISATGYPDAVQHIDSLTSTTLILRDTTGISWIWQVFTKQ